MNCEIINVGTELILGQTVNTNAAFIARKLAEAGIDCYFQTSVGDNITRLSNILKEAIKRSDVVILTGGLGSTDDDITREAIAFAFGKKLNLQPNLALLIEEKMTRLKMPVVRKTMRQAYLPEGGLPVPPVKGTAPGIILEVEGKAIFALPGVPVEMETMLKNSVIPYIQRRYGRGKEIILSRILKICGMREAELEEKIADIIAAQTNPTIAPLVALGQVHLRLTAKASTMKAARELIEREEEKIRDRLEDFIFGVDDEEIGDVVGNLLKRQRLTISVAESITGGLVCSRLVDSPRSSEYFVGGIIAYANTVKTKVLGVSPETLLSEGAVSAACAEQMATGIRHLLGTNIGLALTGIAGPSGGTAEKPVGLVYFALAAADALIKNHYIFRGSRNEIRFKASQRLLNTLRLYLLKKERKEKEPA
jgi:nicotinamide-nucleotide amidase